MVTRSTVRAAPVPLLGLAAALLCLPLQSCVTGPSALAGGTWPGTWPPTSAQCQRTDDVAFSWQTGTISGELNRLHADPHCVPQPTCRLWQGSEHHLLIGTAIGNGHWYGLTNFLFDSTDQDAIIIDARANAIAHTPAGKEFNRLTFSQAVFTGPEDVAGSPQISHGMIQATAHYGSCVSRATHPRVRQQQ